MCLCLWVREPVEVRGPEVSGSPGSRVTLTNFHPSLCGCWDPARVLWSITVFNHTAISAGPEQILLKRKLMLVASHQEVFTLSAAGS